MEQRDGKERSEFHGNFLFVTICPFWIASDEPLIEVEVSLVKDKKPYCLGISERYHVDWVYGRSRDLTDSEFNQIMEECHEDLARQADEKIDRYFQGQQTRQERAMA